MSTISNRFFVQVIDDGTTLHGELRSLGSLSQAWTGAAAVPNWGVDSQSGHYPNSPLIYLTLLSGSSNVQPVSDSIVWEYNGTPIAFSSTQTAIVMGEDDVVFRGYMSTNGLFFKTTYNVGTLESPCVQPALAIVGNLAGNDNLDVDTITIKGGYNVGAANIDFSATASVRITEIKGNGYLGQVNFVNGISDITAKGQTITAYAVLYDQGGNRLGDNDYSTKWYLNDGTAVNGTTKVVGGRSYTEAIQITEDQVTDYATLKCEFYRDGSSPEYTEIVGIDDRQDVEYLYIQMNNANGNAASLHLGDPSVVFKFFVGKNDDPAPENNHPYSGWTFKVKLYDKEGHEVTASDIPDIPNRGTGGYRPLETGSDYKASLSISPQVGKQYFYSFLSGIIYATHA